jgi:hypothetical protein
MEGDGACSRRTPVDPEAGWLVVAANDRSTRELRHEAWRAKLNISLVRNRAETRARVREILRADCGDRSLRVLVPGGHAMESKFTALREFPCDGIPGTAGRDWCSHVITRQGVAA